VFGGENVCHKHLIQLHLWLNVKEDFGLPMLDARARVITDGSMLCGFWHRGGRGVVADCAMSAVRRRGGSSNPSLLHVLVEEREAPCRIPTEVVVAISEAFREFRATPAQGLSTRIRLHIMICDLHSTRRHYLGVPFSHM
jgi:hypothetical protein